MLAYLITEPQLSPDGPLDDTLEIVPDEDALIAALAYEAAPDSAHRCWIPAAGPTPGPRSRSPDPDP